MLVEYDALQNSIDASKLVPVPAPSATLSNASANGTSQKWYPSGFAQDKVAYGNIAMKDVPSDFKCMNNPSGSCLNEYFIARNGCSDLKVVWKFYSDSAYTNLVDTQVTDDALSPLKPKVLEADTSVDGVNSGEIVSAKCVTP